MEGLFKRDTKDFPVLIVHDRRSNMTVLHPVPSQGITHPWEGGCVLKDIEFLDAGAIS